jgi:hypothetical protein
MGHAPALLYTLGLSPFGLALARFPHVLKVVREPLLGPPNSHTLYHAPTNRLGVTTAHILPRFVRLLVSDTKGPRVKKTTQAIFVMESGTTGLVLVLEPTWLFFWDLLCV